MVATLVVLSCLSVAVGFSIQSSILLSNVGSIQYPPAPEVLLSDGFESGDFGAWNGTLTTINDNASVSTAMPYVGGRAANFETGDASSGIRTSYSYCDVSPAISEIHARAYFYISDGLPLVDANDRFGLIAFEIGGQLQCGFCILRTGGVDRFNVIGFNGTSTISVSTDAVYPAEGKWYCIEFYVRVHASSGEYRAWINGVEQFAVTDLDTAAYGQGVTRVRVGLTSTVNVQQRVVAYCDAVVISTTYIGQLRYTFGIVGSLADIPALNNFVFLFGNQSIDYRIVSAPEVTRFEDVDRFDGLVVWTPDHSSYNSTAIQEFAESRVVICDVKDFCQGIYPSLSSSLKVVSTSTVTYVADWGNFAVGDLVDMRNETGNTNQLTTVQASGLSGYSNVTVISQYNSTRVSLFCMAGAKADSGFCTLDLDATTPESDWTGIWHVFPAVKIVQDFPTGQCARWMANGQQWFNLSWVYSSIDSIVNANNDIAHKIVIGQSSTGLDIPAIVIGNGSKNAIFDGAIHGNEKTGTFACLRVAELLIQYYRSDPYWQTKLTQYKVIVVPVVNPDGFVNNTRENANGVDLNSQFPPNGTTTEPEAFAVMNLMGNYTPTVYVNCHEGYYWYPLDMLIGNFEYGANRTLTVNAMQAANETFVSLRHWGWFTDNSAHVWVGAVNAIYQGGKLGMVESYASYQYHASCMLAETFVWSSSYGARQSLWGLDYYPAVILSFLKNLQR
jgi:hypothetical protein